VEGQFTSRRLDPDPGLFRRLDGDASGDLAGTDEMLSVEITLVVG
jgi:hypothetical protein